MGTYVSRAAARGPLHAPWPGAWMLGCTANALFRMLGVHHTLHARGAPVVAVMTPKNNHHVEPATSVEAAKQRGECARLDLDNDSSRVGHESDHSSGLNLHRSPSFPGS
ncbi:hypothetical protein GGP41_008747 [Bipolaris sorokiniana]|uniref:Uncharacterized protein n=1 Tax=Cochliobolus sativus TaxID=45130 RepID=A0A8H5ZB79_COCSA|nr:hypothetical protein GGP41_008747 [Bipolaris sorokiniana]